MDFLFLALVLYAVGAITMLWPKRLEMLAHAAGMVLASAASALTLAASAMYLGTMCGWGVPTGLTLGRFGALMDVSWGGYSLVVDGWSAAFLLITGLAGTVISLYGMDYGKAYRGTGIRALAGLWNLFLASMVLVLMAGDGFTFILAFSLK